MTADAGWDFDAQRAETTASVMQIAGESGLEPGAPVRLDLAFVPGEGADRTGFVAAMREAGFRGHAYDDPEAGTETIVAEVPGVPFGAETIWSIEERTARIALAHGYMPDGWGFEIPED